MRARNEPTARILPSVPASECEVKDGDLLTVSLDGEPIAHQVRYCRSAGMRRKGMLWFDSISEEQGALLVMPDNRGGKSGLMTSIHMLGVSFPLAIGWIDDRFEIVCARLARPWRPYYASPEPASFVLELHPAHLTMLLVGTAVSWKITDR